MHATKQPYISAKLFRKRLLQYCWKGKKEKASVNERMNAQHHCTSKTKINSDRKRNVKLANWLLWPWRDTLRLLCSQSPGPSGLRLSSSEHSRAPFAISKASTSYRRLLWKRHVWRAFAFLCLTSGNKQVSLTCNFYFQVPCYTVWAQVLRTSRVFF